MNKYTDQEKIDFFNTNWKHIEKIIDIDDRHISVMTLKATTSTGEEYCGCINDFDLDEFETYCRPITDLEKLKYL